MKKEIICLSLIIVLAVSLISANDSPKFNVCCEKTDSGAWCQNTLEENCNQDYRKTPTSCDSTSFCRLGCCIDTEEGLCMENTPQKVCEISTGTWDEDEECNVPQCTLGCCLLGDQASFVTLTRCKRLSSIYGLETNFKIDVPDEASCIEMAYYQDRGACVYEIDNQRTCKFTTREACINSEKTGNITSEVEFFRDYLCSADELATDCGPTTETMCVEGKDEVYFKDSCGNPANIYDAEKVYSKDPSYWKKVVSKQNSCGSDSETGNVNSMSCGNCDYLQGSLCGKGNAVYGDLTCKNLNCYNTENGKDYRNGESWCVYQGEVGNGRDYVGSRHFRHVCINGEETIEPCADFRNEICVEEAFDISYGRFLEAACTVNRWESCINQYDKDDCLNTDRRDCFWAEGVHYSETLGSIEENETEDDESFLESIYGTIFGSSSDDSDVEEGVGILSGGGICLPDNPPGLKFWEEGIEEGESGTAQTVCSLANTREVVYYEEGLFGGKECSENCEVLTDSWVQKINDVCKSLGDCGAYVNIVGRSTNKGVLVRVDGEKRVLTGILEGIMESSLNIEEE